jgi:site-specific DNA-methyltransferase (adenine-specific)/adenine-specific DNA-methyltransferase
MAGDSKPPSAPRLEWPGRPGRGDGPDGPAELRPVAEFRPAGAGAPAGTLIYGDNLAAMRALIADGFAGRFAAVYIDPPFNVGAEFRLPGGSRSRRAATAYSDRWGRGAGSAMGAYLSMMLPRLAAVRRLLADDGFLWIHADFRAVHYLRVLADEVFGPEHFDGEVIWRHQVLGAGPAGLSKMHETLLRYRKTFAARLRTDAPEARIPYGDYILRTAKRDPDGRWYYERRAVRADDKGRNLKTYFDPSAGKPVGDLWGDLPSYQPPGDEKWGYPTQKPEALLRRVIALSSPRGGLVGDFFCGSGTTAAAAADLGRRFVGCDASAAAVHVAAKRLTCRPKPVSLSLQSAAGTAWPEWPSPPAVRRVDDASGVRIELPADAGIDFAAVDWDFAGGAPVFTEVAGRSRKRPELPARIPGPPAGGPRRRLRVRLADAQGRFAETDYP